MEILGELSIATLLSVQTGSGSETVEGEGVCSVSVVPSSLWQSLSPRKSLLEILVNTLGDASAKAQGLPAPVTTLLKLQTSGDAANGGCAHRMYIASLGNKAFGFIKVGRKQLFLSVPSYVREGKSRSAKRCDMITKGEIPGGQTTTEMPTSPRLLSRGGGSSSMGIVNQEISPLCVLDFFVHSSVRRSGIGRILFDQMAVQEALLIQSGRGGGGGRSIDSVYTNSSASLSSTSHFIVNPAKLGYDRPSALFTSFLRKHFGLESATPQPYSMLVFNDYFAESDLIKVPRGASQSVDGASARNSGNDDTEQHTSDKNDINNNSLHHSVVIPSAGMSSPSVSTSTQPLPSSVPHPSRQQALPFSPFRPLQAQQQFAAPPVGTSSSPYNQPPSQPQPSLAISSGNKIATTYSSPNNVYNGRGDLPTASLSSGNGNAVSAVSEGEKSTFDVLRGMTLNPSRYHGQTHLSSLSTSSSSSSLTDYAFSPSSLSMPIPSFISQPAATTPIDVPHAFGQGRSPLRNSSNTRIGTDNSSNGVSKIFTNYSNTYTKDTQEIEEQGSLAAAVRRNARLFGRSPQ
jgi:hypothetical protein